MDVVVVLLGAYVTALLLKRATRLRGEGSQMCVVMALVLVPLVVAAWFATGGRPLQALALGARHEVPDTWWWITIHQKEGEASTPVNWLGAALWLTLIYLATTLAIQLADQVARRRGSTPWQSIHRALVKLPILAVSTLALLKIDLSTIVLSTSVLVVGLGFVLRETLENLLTGMTLELEGTVRQGDWIQVGDGGRIGKVYEKTWRAAKIQTLTHESITIPHRVLAAEHITNLDRPTKPHARLVRVGASYADPPIKVKDILRTILLRDPEILDVPAPLVRTVSYDDFAVVYEMKYWIQDYSRRMDIEDHVLTRVWYAFRFYGIEIPFPIRTVHLKEQAERAAEASRGDDSLDRRRRFLEGFELFAKLTPKELDFLAQNAFLRDYAPGEHVVHQGDLGRALHLVVGGACEAVLPDARPRLEAGQYFGEMGMLSGERRTVDVVASADGAQVLRVDQHCMQVLLDKHGELREEFDATGATRRSELEAEPVAAPVTPPHLLTRLRRRVADYLLPW